MATKSMLKEVVVRSERRGQALADALEEAAGKTVQRKTVKCAEVKRESVKKFFDTY